MFPCPHTVHASFLYTSYVVKRTSSTIFYGAVEKLKYKFPNFHVLQHQQYTEKAPSSKLTNTPHIFK